MATNLDVNANAIFETVERSTETGFSHILIFAILAAAVAYLFVKFYFEHKDRVKTKTERDEQWAAHDKQHIAETGIINCKLEAMQASSKANNEFVIGTMNTFIENQKKINDKLFDITRDTQLTCHGIKSILDYKNSRAQQ
jgi:hypothetical protein